MIDDATNGDPMAEATRTEAEGDDLTRFLSYRLMRLHSALNAQATALLSREGLTLGQWRLLALCGAGLAGTSRDFARFFGLDPAFVSRTLRALAEAGLMEVRRHGKDRRMLDVALTARGRALHDAILPRMRGRQAALLDALDPAERRALHPILDKLERAAERRDFPA